MKKAILFLLSAVMLLTAGCGARAPAETAASVPQQTEAPETVTVPETEPTEDPLPETAEALVLADRVPAILMFKDRGDTLDIVGDWDEAHYVVKTEDGYGLVQKFLVRTEGQEPYEVWTGYARYNTELFGSWNLRGEPLQVLSRNTEVRVLEDLGSCLVVELEEGTGFVKKAQISQWKSSGGSGSSGSSSGSSSGGGSGGGSGEGQDGGDISLQISGGFVPLAIIDQTGDITGTAQVLADGTPVILGYFDRADAVPVVLDPAPEQEMEGYSLLRFEELYAYMRFPMLQLPGEESYEAWDGFVARNGKCYGNFDLTGEPMAGVWTNVPVHVIADLEDCYLVEVNGNPGYMAKDQVSQTRVPASSGGSSSGNSGGSGGSSGGREWSDPVL